MAICYAFDAFFPGKRLYWGIISVLLVISPDDRENLKLPVARIKANVIGSIIGLGCFLLPVHTLLAMALGVVLVILVCTFFRLGAATRSALAALVIVLVQEVSDRGTVSAVQRMVSVILGCVVALAVAVTSRAIRGFMCQCGEDSPASPDDGAVGPDPRE